MDPQQLLAFALDPGRILAAQGIDPDPWQQELLLARAARILLNCCRGAGKSRVTSALALHTALFHCDAQARPVPASVVPLTPVSEIEKAVARQLAAIDFEAIARKTVQEHLERLAGRV